MTKLWIVPIEPLEERYTGEWFRLLPGLFAKHFDEVEQIEGVATTDHVEVGTFLDINSTVHYKSTQMMKISQLFQSKQIKPGDVFFISDIEFWGIEALRMLSQMNKVPIKIYGFLHAASYTKEDAFAVAAPYQKFTEVGWLAACDGVFVGSHYHKRAFVLRRLDIVQGNAEYDELFDKLIVTGNPLFNEAYKYLTQGALRTPRKNRILITNRFDSEKRPNESLEIALEVKRARPDTEIVVTTGRPNFTSNDPDLVKMARKLEAQGLIKIASGLTKEQYHEYLATSKVMLTNSIEENFGYCIAEAIIHGCQPVAPHGLSHDELIWSGNLFWRSEPEKAAQIIGDIFDARPDEYFEIEQANRENIWHCFNAVDKMAEYMTNETKV